MSKQKLETGDELMERLTKLWQSKRHLIEAMPDSDTDSDTDSDYYDDLKERTSDLLWTIKQERKY